jgi:regulator of sigma E protease
VGYALPFLIMLTIVVFIHELGHFLVARWCGVRVLTFSVGFGNELFGFTDKHGTRWKLAAIPLGGYVRFFGDESEASTPSASALEAMSADDRKVSFHHKNVAQRAAIVAAGPIANFLLAIVVFAGLYTIYGRPNATPRVDVVEAGSAAAAAGFQPGDIVTSIDGSTIDSFSDMQRIVSMRADQQLNITVTRGDAKVVLRATPQLREMKDAFGTTHKVGVLGIKRNDITTEKVDPLSAVWLGAKQVWNVIDSTFTFLGGLFAGRGGADQIGGPLRIAQLSGQAASLGLDYFMNLTAVISVSIGLLNLFPVPLLDGGHLMYYLVEFVRGRPLSERAQEMGFRVGLALVLMLMIFATYNDILHISSIFKVAS